VQGGSFKHDRGFCTRSSERFAGVIPLDLRPLGIGEILDRAVTLFVRRFAVLFLILALVAIPVTIVQYAAAPATAGVAADLQSLFTLPAGQSAERQAIVRRLETEGRVGGFGFALVLLSAILSALSTTACVIAAAQAYAGKMPSVREVYREALRRWLAQLAALAAIVALALALTVLLAIAIFFITLAIAALANMGARLVVTIVGVLVALVIGCAFFGVLIMVYFAAQMTVVSIALEDPNPASGIARGFRRTFSPAVIRRSALVATIVFGVSMIGSLLLITFAGVLSAVTHFNALYPVVAVIGGLALNALVTTFIVIYAIDVRVRREGYDLALAAQEVTL
jgi:hypothetical protein